MATNTENGRTSARSSLAERVVADEARLAADERRLELDEARLTADEERLTVDEKRMLHGERSIQRNWWMIIAVAIVVGLTITSLVLSIIALNQHIDTVAANPTANSVRTEDLMDSSVTPDKLASESVTAAKLAPGSVIHESLGRGSVAGANVAPNSIVGADINERTLGKVPTAATAQTAGTAGNAAALGGLPATSFLTVTKYVQATSPNDKQPLKTVTATAPVGYRVIGGGASIEGTPGKIAILTSTPAGKTGWTAVAAAVAPNTGAWSLQVTAIITKRPS